MMSNNINIDTQILNNSANNLNSVKRRISNLEMDAQRLYWRTGKSELWDMSTVELDVGCKKIKKSIDALINVADDFQDTEKPIQNGGLLLDGLDSLKYANRTVAAKIYYKTTDLISDIGNAIQRKAQDVRSDIEELLVNYYSKGWVYKTVQYGKVAIKAAKGVSKIVTGVGSIFASGGLSTPVAILSVVSGLNDVYNSLVDGVCVYNEDYDSVGKTNVLKDRMVEGGEMLGELVGNKQLGNTVANVAYYGIDIITSLGTIQSKHYFEQLRQIKPTDKTKLLSEIKELSSMNISDIRVDDYGMKLMSYAYSETTKAIANAGLFVKTVGEYVGVAKQCNSAYSKMVDGFENPVVNFLDKIDSIKENIGKGIKASKSIGEFVFD